MRRIREVIVVEGKYDVIRVKSAVDAMVIPTDGFSIFNRPEERALLRRLAEERGIVVLTDSDSAGALIRNHLNGFLPPDRIRHAYVPPIPGKERRKASPGKEGLLGVEGIDGRVIVEALERAGATFSEEETAPDKMHLTKTDLYKAGLSGRPDSAARRKALLKRLDLPQGLSANRLLDVLNAAVSPEEWTGILREIGENPPTE